MKEDEIHVLLGTDERNVPGALVTMTSCVRFATPGTRFAFHVMDFDLRDETKSRMFDFFGRNPATAVQFHSVDLAPFEEANAPRFMGTYRAYARCLAPRFLDIDRVVYIDTDIFVQKNLREIWTMDMDGVAFAGCLNTSKGGEPGCDRMSHDCPWSDDRDFLARPYFNSGFLLVNLDEWRRLDLPARALALVKETTKQYRHDQALINFICSGKTRQLPGDWNFVPWWTRPVPPEVNFHYTSKFKPWTTPHFLPAERIWLEFYGRVVKPFWDPAKATRRPAKAFAEFLRFYGLPALAPKVYCELRRKFRNDAEYRAKNDLIQLNAVRKTFLHGLDGESRKAVRDSLCTIRDMTAWP